MRSFVCLLFALTGLWQARAQTLALGVGTGLGATPRLGVELRDMRDGGTTSTLRFAVDTAVEIGVDLRRSEVFGPLGNVIVEFGGRLRTDGAFEVDLGARGVLGPVALAVVLSAFDAPPAAFDPAAGSGATRPVGESGTGLGLEIDAEMRVDRSLVIGLSPDVYLLDGRVAARLQGAATLLQLVPEVDGVAALQGYAGPGFESGHAAVGVGAVWRRRRAPQWHATLWLGAGPIVSPGVTAHLSEPLGNGISLTLDAAIEPYRLDIAPYRLAATVLWPAAAGTLELSTAFAYRNEARIWIRLGYELPLER